MADVNTLRVLEELKERVSKLEGASYAPPLRVVQAAGFPCVELDDPSHYARINGTGSGGKYPHIEVVPDPATPGGWVNLASGRSGTLTESPAWETNLSTTVPTDGSYIVRVHPHPNGRGWVFDAASPIAVLGWYALITGGTGPYSWSESTVAGVVISGGRTGTNNAYEQISGLTGIPTTGVVVWMTTGAGGQPFKFNAIMITQTLTWNVVTSGTTCTLVPNTTRKVVFSGPNLCGSFA